MGIENIKKENNELHREIEKLKKQNQALKSKKKYGLVWEEEREPEEIVLNCQNKVPILTEETDKKILTAAEKPVNILIEGDNYHALSVLNYTHSKKIDIIYIDPPYNTGKRTWKYNNDYVDREDVYRHSKWLNFMKHRLSLAQNLLKEKGTLICAVDENEHETLGLLLQELFPNKEIACITIIHNPGGIQGNNFSYCHEYAYFVYPSGGTFISKVRREDVPPTPFRDWGKESSKREASKTCFYPIYVKENKVIGFGKVCPDNFHPRKSNIFKIDGTIEIYPIDGNGVERKWRFSIDTVKKIKDELICEKIRNEFVILREKKDYRWKTVWTDKRYNANEYGTKLLKRIVKKNFPYPKSLYTVKDCLKAVIHDKSNAIILDFFAGSGTAGHAVLEMNKDDGGNRKFILCTNNEDNDGDGIKICSDICYPRIKNVIQGYSYTGKDRKLLFEAELDSKHLKNLSEIAFMINQTTEDYKNSYDELEEEIENSTIQICGVKNINKKTEGLGGNLRYFKTNLLEIKNIAYVSDEEKIELTYNAGKMIALREETFEEIEKNNWWQIFKNNEKFTAIYFKEDKSKLNELVSKLVKIDSKISLYIFGWGINEYKNELSIYKNIQVQDIPEPIIDVYKEVNKLG